MDFHSGGLGEENIASLHAGFNLPNELQSADIPETCKLLVTDDYNIKSNTSFKYYIFENAEVPVLPGIIFLFHGLNEKKWDKYLPWAYELTKQTGKRIILFPIAFHMDRAPHEWSDSRLMNRVAAARAIKTSNSHSSFANAALSERLELRPQRFFLSGLQTYIDFCTLIERMRSGKIEDIPSDSSIDLFGYSIGAFFSLLLMLDNPNNILEDSRLFIFCGGATYDRTFPVSKFIVDKNASDSVSYFFDELFKNKPDAEKKIAYYFKNYSPVNSHFAGIMNYKLFKDLRENRLAKIYERINAIALVGDKVIPPDDVKDTLKGEFGNIKTKVETMDFDYPYNHITPFPVMERYKTNVDVAFKTVFEQASSFLS